MYKRQIYDCTHGIWNISAAVGLSAGFLLKHAFSTSLAPWGINDSMIGSVVLIRWTTPSYVSASYGVVLVKHNNKVIPNDQTSTLYGSYGLPVNTSGGIKLATPGGLINVEFSLTLDALKKEPRKAIFRLLKKMLSGFMSKWTIFCECK